MDFKKAALIANFLGVSIASLNTHYAQSESSKENSVNHAVFGPGENN
jgi:hypothetical protein